MNSRAPHQSATSPHHLELGRFLAARRAEVTPTQVGLPEAGARRTPGLRREEVALLAGVSVSWYTWIEQGRAGNVSGEVLDAIARTLLLEGSQRIYLRRLAGIHASYPAPASVRDPDNYRPFVENWRDFPAYIADRQWNILVANAATRTLLGVGDDDNLLWELFTSAATSTRYPDWEKEAAHVVARFRGQAVPQADDPRMTALVRRIRAASPLFAELWDRHEVTEDACGPIRIAHPRTGRLHFKRTTLDFTDRVALRLTVFYPLPGTTTGQAVRDLADARTHTRGDESAAFAESAA